MVCGKCGAEMRPDEAFCSECGAPVVRPAPISGPSDRRIGKEQRCSTISVFVVMLTLIMLVSMILLPMFKLRYDFEEEDDYYSVSLLGGASVNSSELATDIGYICAGTFVLLNATVITTAILSLLKRRGASIAMACTDLGILLVSYCGVVSCWENVEYAKDFYRTDLDIGFAFCLFGAIMMAILTFVDRPTEQ